MPGYTNQIAELRASLEAANLQVATVRGEYKRSLTAMRSIYSSSAKIHQFVGALNEIPYEAPTDVELFLESQVGDSVNTPLMADHVLQFLGRLTLALNSLQRDLTGIGGELIKAGPVIVRAEAVKTETIPSPLIRSVAAIDAILLELSSSRKTPLADRGNELIEAANAMLEDKEDRPDSAASIDSSESHIPIEEVSQPQMHTRSESADSGIGGIGTPLAKDVREMSAAASERRESEGKKAKLVVTTPSSANKQGHSGKTNAAAKPSRRGGLF